MIQLAPYVVILILSEPLAYALGAESMYGCSQYQEKGVGDIEETHSDYNI